MCTTLKLTFVPIFRVIVEAALRDIDRFKRQKVKDLREIFTNYAVMQIKQCKKVSGTGYHRPNSARELVRQSRVLQLK